MSKRVSSSSTVADHIELIARGIIIERGHLLLCRNVQHAYHFLPGGHVECSESAPDALARELLEECGLKSTPGPLLLTSEHLFTRPPSSKAKGAAAKPRACHEINLVFHVEPHWPKPRKSAKPASSAKLTPLPKVTSKEAKIAFDWIDPAALVDLDFRPLSIKAWLMTADAPAPTTPGGNGGFSAMPAQWLSER